jgi:hypothetical protein
MSTTSGTLKSRIDLRKDDGSQIETMQQRNGKLLAHCGRIEKQKAAVMGQMAEMQEKWGQAASEGSRLQAEIATMRQTLEVCPCPTALGACLHTETTPHRRDSRLFILVQSKIPPFFPLPSLQTHSQVKRTLLAVLVHVAA